MNIELYIDNKLCDLDKSDLSIRLKRQFFKPTELNYKDSQKSYNINLPSTPINDAIFKYTNVEETEDKFSTLLDARLYIDGILILDGSFRLTQIARDSYQGNLGIPAPMTAKDAFGEMKMNSIGEWIHYDWKRKDSINAINKSKNPPFFFPLVMHKLFNRSNIVKDQKRDSIDSNVNLRYDDIPASINCVELLKTIFANAKYKLEGTALDDERLNSLYVSYKNPNDYVLDWDIRPPLHFTGHWGLISNDNFESRRVVNHDKSLCIFDIFNGTNNRIDDNKQDRNGWLQTTSEKGVEIVIPKSGYYKITFKFVFNFDRENEKTIDNFNIVNGYPHKEPHSSEICLVKKGKRELKDYTLLFNADQALGLNFFSPFFFVDDTVISAFSIGKTAYARDKGFKNIFAYTPMVAKGTAVQSPGYSGQNKIEFAKGVPTTEISSYNISESFGNGTTNQIVWLEKGDRLGMIDVTTLIDQKTLPQHNMTYTLTIQPFRSDKEWLELNPANNNSYPHKPINWYDTDNYYENKLNITQFLPSEINVNDWIDNFCKVFNLKLTHIGDKLFSLDLQKTSIATDTSKIIDLDQKTNVHRAQNAPLNLPMQYELGFTINNKEHGYILTSEKVDKKIVTNTGNDGGGLFKTNSLDTKSMKQNSNFSYCWYKPIDIVAQGKFDIPIITEDEIWQTEKNDYQEMMEKKSFNLPQRFWYKDGTKTVKVKLEHNDVDLALVTNSYKGDKPLELDYKDKPNSIMRNYFMLLTNEKNYTTVECYLSPQEYADLSNSLIKLNGDLYFVAEADGYDPMNKSKTKLKLIKKM